MANPSVECPPPSNYDNGVILPSTELHKHEIPSGKTSVSMNRIKQALLSQLQATYDRVKNQVLEERDELQKAKKEREDIGVELYGLQQQLSQLQKQLISKQNNYEALDAKRKRDEESISELKSRQKRKFEKYENIKKQTSDKQSESKELETVLINIRRFNEATKNEISISKTVAEKTKEVFEEIQKEKEAQDIYLDSLSEQIHQHEKQIYLTKEQLKVQNIQTTEADSMIKAITIDLEDLVSEKKKLLQQWNSSLFALGQRDQALGATVKEFNKTEDAIRMSAMENKQLEKDITRLKTFQDTLMLTRKKLQKEIDHMGIEVEKILSAKESNEEAIDLLSKSVVDTRELEELEERAVKKHLIDAAGISYKIDILTINYQKVEEDIQKHRAEQASQSREALEFMKEEKKISSAIHECEMELTVIENDIASLNIELLKTEEQSTHLNVKREVEVNVVKQLNEKIATMESNIRRSHDSIKAKMNKVDQLNRKYEKIKEMTMDGDDEPLGPLEATIKRLEKIIKKQEKINTSLASTWSSDQRVLIEVIDKSEVMKEKERDYSAILSVLKHQRMRLQRNIHSNKASLTMISTRINNMHVDTSRLNELIGRHETMQTELTNEISLRKVICAEQIENLSNRLVQMKHKVRDIDVKKATALEDIIHEEKNILLLQKNIELEKETQAALNSSENADEIKGMEKEIQRMHHRLEQINRQQERLLREIEATIAKRNDISAKYQYNTKTNSSSNNSFPITVADVKKKCTEFTKLDENQLKEGSAVLSEISKLTNRKSELELMMERLTASVNEKQQRKRKVHSAIISCEFEKQKLISRINVINDFLKRCQSIALSAPEMSIDRVEVQRYTLKIEMKMSKLMDAVTKLKSKYIEYEEVVSRVETLLCELKEIKLYNLDLDGDS